MVFGPRCIDFVHVEPTAVPQMPRESRDGRIIPTTAARPMGVQSLARWPRGAPIVAIATHFAFDCPPSIVPAELATETILRVFSLR